MNKFFSIFPFLLFIILFSELYPNDLNTGFKKENEQNSGIEYIIEKLASSDSSIVEEAIINLAKSGDSRLEKFFELYRQGSVYNWPTDSGGIRIVVNEETVMDDDFNEFAPLLDPLSGLPVIVDGEQAKPDLLDLEDISPSRKLRSLVNSSKFLLRLFSQILKPGFQG